MQDRYQRQRMVGRIGEAGQARIGAAHAVVVGVGALGCVTADHLVRAGVGRVTVIDRDIVDRSNLHRQSLFTEADADAGVPKAEAARARLSAANSEVEVRAVIADVTGPRAEGLVFGPDAPAPDVLIDGTDNFETRYVLNDLSVSRGVPLVYAGVVGTRGTAAALVPGRTPCLRCIAPEPPAPGTVETCDTAGVIGPAVGVVASWQAAEALKILSGNAHDAGRVMVDLDVWSGVVRTIALEGLRDPACPCCVGRVFEFLRAAPGEGATVLCGRGTVQITPRSVGAVDLGAVEARMGATVRTHRSALFVRATLEGERRESEENPVVLTVFGDGRALVSGVSTAERARTIYARYVGL